MTQATAPAAISEPKRCIRRLARAGYALGLEWERESLILMKIGTLRVVTQHGTMHQEYNSSEGKPFTMWGQTDYYISFSPTGSLRNEIDLGHIKLAQGVVVPVELDQYSANRIVGTDMIEMLAKRGIATKAKAISIDTFFPFSRLDSEQEEGYKRKGIGGALLSKVLEDCASEGVAVVVAYTFEFAMTALLRKFEFETYKDGVYFKILKPIANKPKPKLRA
jgi:GNAT superfamily N-acetyltransferase